MKLIDAARAVVERWELPVWKDAPATAVYIAALRAAIAAAEQPAEPAQPVYWQWRRKDQPWRLEQYTFNSEVKATTDESEVRALYAAPPAQPAPLTDAQISDCAWGYFPDSKNLPEAIVEFARAVEAAHGIGRAP